MNTSSRHHSFVLSRVFIDILLIPLVFILAYTVKFKIGWIAQNIFAMPFGKIYDHAQVEPYLMVAPFVIALWMNSFYLSGMYRKFAGLMPLMDELVSIIKGVSIGTIQVIVFSFIYAPFPGSRYVVFYAWLLGIAVVFCSRVVVQWVEIYFLKTGVGQYRSLVVGCNELGQDVAERMLLYPTLRLNYVGTVDEESPQQLHFHLKDSYRHLGEAGALQSIIEVQQIKVVFVTKRLFSNEALAELVKYCQTQNVELKVLSDIADISAGHIEVEELDGIPFLSFKPARHNAVALFIKRVFDILVSGCLMLVLSPVYLITVILIKTVSPGPAFFIQTRISKHGREFGMIKFRTMINDAEKDTGPVMVNSAGDSRVIKCGRFLRRTSMDELPQLFNVLKGEMSLVGPRPERPHFVADFSKRIPFYSLRHQVPAGITGWAQVNGRAYLTDRPEQKIKYDLYYIKNWSLILDFKILIKTLTVVLKKEEAY